MKKVALAYLTLAFVASPIVLAETLPAESPSLKIKAMKRMLRDSDYSRFDATVAAIGAIPLKTPADRLGFYEALAERKRRGGDLVGAAEALDRGMLDLEGAAPTKKIEWFFKRADFALSLNDSESFQFFSSAGLSLLSPEAKLPFFALYEKNMVERGWSRHPEGKAGKRAPLDLAAAPLDAAKKLLAQGRPGEALEKLPRSGFYALADAEYDELKLQILLALHREEEALKFLDGIPLEELTPQNLFIRLKLALALDRDGQRMKEWESLELSLDKVEPNLIRDILKLGAFLHMAKGNLKKADELFGKLLLFPGFEADEFISFYHALTRLQIHKTGNESLARANLRLLEKLSLESLNPKVVKKALKELGNHYFNLEDYGRAGSYFEGAVGRDPSDDRSLFMLARARQNQKLFQDAGELFTRLLGEFPHSEFRVESMIHLAACHQENGDFQSALTAMEQAGTMVKGDHSNMDLRRAELLILLGKNSLAQKILENLLAKDGDPQCRKNALSILLNTRFNAPGGDKKRLQFLTGLAESKGSLPFFKLAHAEELFRQNQWQTLKRVLAIREGEEKLSPAFLGLRGATRWQLGDTQGALADFRLWNFSPDGTFGDRIALFHAQALKKAGKTGECRETLQQFLKFYPKSNRREEALVMLCRMVEAAGDPAGAADHWLAVYHLNGREKGLAFQRLKEIYAKK